MKTSLAALLVSALTAIATGRAAPLTVTTAVHAKPDATLPAISYLKAGTDPTPTIGVSTALPPGWIAVELKGPFEGFVENKDLAKSLDVKPGAPIRLAPKADAAVLALAEESDRTTITGIRGKWTQISLDRKIIGYAFVGAAPATSFSVPAAPAPTAPPPVTPGVYGVTSAGQPAPTVSLGDGGINGLPRQYTGRFVSTRRPFTPRRPFDHALNDEAGKRYAYVDVSRLQQPEQIEKYLNLNVIVFGTAAATADGRDIVVRIESIQLK
jgi:hypothetical protein